MPRPKKEEGGEELQIGSPEPESTLIPKEALQTEREVLQDDQLRKAQSQIQTLIKQVQRLAGKTGIAVEEVKETEDGLATLSTDFLGRTITSWRMLPGSSVVLSPEGHVVDNQFVEVTTEDGEKEKMPYLQFAQMTASRKIPVKILGYLKKNAFGQWVPIKTFKQDDEVRVKIGHWDGQDKVYDGPELTVKMYMLN